MDISIIVTVYNLEKYIGECLDSILNQKGIEFEVICVDDCSNDNSYKILLEYAQKDKRVKVIRNDINKGVASSRNVGFREAGGEYLYSMDGDDMLIQDALKRMYTCAKKNQLDLLGFCAKSFYDGIWEEQYTEEYYVRKNKYPYVRTGIELFNELENNDEPRLNIVFYLYRRQYFIENHLYNIEGLRYAEDSVFSMYMTAKRAMCINDQLYLRRYREGSLVTSKPQKYYMECMILLYIDEIERWRECSFDKEMNIGIEQYFIKRLKEIKGMYSMIKNDNAHFCYLDKNPVAEYFYKYFIEEMPLYSNSISANEMKRVKSYKDIILYGSGYLANEFAKVMEYNNVYYYKTAVTKKNKAQTYFRGRNIFEISELESYKDRAIVIIAVSRKYQKEVMGTLESYGFQNIIRLELD